MAMNHWEYDLAKDAGAPNFNLQSLSNLQVSIALQSNGAPRVGYADALGATSLGSTPTFADGKADIYLPGGIYKLVATASGYTRTFENVHVGNSAGTDVGVINFAGYTFSFEAETTSPPSANAFRANNADLSAATEWYIADAALNGHDLAAYLLALAPAASNTKNEMTITDPATGDTVTVDIDGTTDGAGFTTLAVSNHSGATSLTVGSAKLTFAKAGARGAVGTAATITVGTTSSVPATDPPTVTNSGTPSAAILDFEIPAGQGLDFDIQVDLLADRATYDSEAAGYRVLVSDVGDGRAAVYSRVTGTPGVWSDPAYLGGGTASFGSSLLFNSIFN